MLVAPIWAADIGDVKSALEEAKTTEAPAAPQTQPVAPAAKKSLPVPENLACRFAERIYSSEYFSNIEPLIDVNLNTRSKDPKDRCFETTIVGGRKLGACLQEVKILLPRDRFNVTVTLDGTQYMRSGHMDLDIFLQMEIDKHFYVLHCMPDMPDLTPN